MTIYDQTLVSGVQESFPIDPAVLAERERGVALLDCLTSDLRVNRDFAGVAAPDLDGGD